jgi:nuclear transport factor 2 (NTF2) superfamily protein
VLDNPGVLLGLMRWRDASINDYRIDAGDRRLHPRGPAS